MPDPAARLTKRILLVVAAFDLFVAGSVLAAGLVLGEDALTAVGVVLFLSGLAAAAYWQLANLDAGPAPPEDAPNPGDGSCERIRNEEGKQ